MSNHLFDSAPILLIVNMLLLGIRHGIDWDHIAAVTDIVGTSKSSTITTLPATSCKRSVVLASFYALGHSFSLILISIFILLCTYQLPHWFNPVIERLVGATLVLFGGYVLISAVQAFILQSPHRLWSRGSVMINLINHLHWLATKPQSRSRPMLTGCTGSTALGIGIIHGLGAETSTQVLLLSAVNAAASYILGAALVGIFVTGFVLSNTFLAFVLSAGYLTTAKLKPLNVAIGILSGAFSIFIGISFMIGQANALPTIGAAE